MADPENDLHAQIDFLREENAKLAKYLKDIPEQCNRLNEENNKLKAKLEGFSDDDLKRLKVKINRSPQGSVFETKPQWEALLSRLEAAEACLINAPLKEGGVLNEADVKTWRKAAGK